MTKKLFRVPKPPNTPNVGVVRQFQAIPILSIKVHTTATEAYLWRGTFAWPPPTFGGEKLH